MPALCQSCRSEQADVYDPKLKKSFSGISNRRARVKSNDRSKGGIGIGIGIGGCTGSLANLKDVINGGRKMEEKMTDCCSPRSVQSNDLFRPNEKLFRQHNLSNPKMELHILQSSSASGRSKQRGEEEGLGQVGTPSRVLRAGSSNNRSSRGGSSGMVNSSPLSRFGSCYDCSSVQNPAMALVVYRGASVANDPLLLQPTCQRCGESFNKIDSLELHHFLKHSLRELKPGDSSRNVVEIIFRTSWLKMSPDSVPLQGSSKPLQIERVLKIHNLARTLAKFEEYRDGVKLRASKLSKKHPRCLADGNELLRFYGTSLKCSTGGEENSKSPSVSSSGLDEEEGGGLEGEGGLCRMHSCNACGIIRSGFSKAVVASPLGVIYTTATSGRAHDFSTQTLLEKDGSAGIKNAMIVCRVIAGRVHKSLGHSQLNPSITTPPPGFDSIAGQAGPYSNIEELYVCNPEAILPCFLVIYSC